MVEKVLVSEMLKFHFGNKITYADGQEGTLTQLLVDSSSKQLTHLVTKQGRFFSKTSVFSFEQVSRATGDGIWLSTTLAQAVAFSDHEHAGVALDQHTVVKTGSGSGTLAMVAVHPEGGTLAYIVAHNVLAGHDILLGAQDISSLEAGQLVVSTSDEVLRSQPPYRSDSTLQQEVESILFDLGFLHIDLRGMNLRVLDGVLYMEGNISSTLRGELAYDQVSGVSGLLEIKNNLIGDDMLAADIAHALGHDSRTRELPIGVYPQLGFVRLSGSVSTPQQKDATLEIARSFAGVCGVTENLVVDPSAAMLYVMSAPEGGEAKDITPGKFTRHTS